MYWEFRYRGSEEPGTALNFFNTQHIYFKLPFDFDKGNRAIHWRGTSLDFPSYSFHFITQNKFGKLNIVGLNGQKNVVGIEIGSRK